MGNNKKTLYIFIDESGNFDFSSSGTKFFVLTSITTLYPLSQRLQLIGLRYALLKKGIDQEYFHATEDEQKVRDYVYHYLNKLDDIEVDAVIAQKNKTNPSLYIEHNACPKKGGRGFIFKTIHLEEKFYKLMSQTLLRYIFSRYHNLDNIEGIVVILGKIFTKNKRGYVLKSLKQYLKAQFQKPFYIYFHKSESDINCQLADYCGWAIYVKAERKEDRPIKSLNGKIKSVFDIFQRGTTEYYVYKK